MLDCDYDELQIYNSIYKCLFDDKFRNFCRNSLNPYGIGNAGKKIVDTISTIDINDNLLTKKMTIKGEENSGWYR